MFKRRICIKALMIRKQAHAARAKSYKDLLHAPMDVQQGQTTLSQNHPQIITKLAKIL